MAYATLAEPAPFSIDPNLIAAARRTTAKVAAAVAFLLQSLTAASILWLILAGPGALSDRASTTPNPRMMMAG